MTVSDINWFFGKAPEKTDLSVKLRHGPNYHACEVASIDEKNVQVNLAKNDQGIAPGQIAAFYDGDVCLGAGIISS